ncbi:two-component system histidine kinase PnpS [Thiovibrio sp. JS02]
MHPNRLLWQLFPSQLLITIAALLAFTWFGTYTLRSFQLDQTAAGLKARALLVESNVLQLLRAGDTAGLRSFCQEAGNRAGTRLTVIAPDGTVLADSDEEPFRMENHRDRPEILAAFAGRIAPSLRFSQTLQANLMYVAIPVVDRQQNVAVLRTAVPVTSIDDTLRDIHRQIAWGCLMVALVVALIAWFISRRISKPLEEMKLGAERFADGDFTLKMKEEGSEEVAGLARAMNDMAAQLDRRIETIVRQHNQLQAVFSSMVEGVVTVDAEERLLDINQAGAQFLNVDLEKVRGRSIRVAVRNTQLQSFVQKALACAEPIEGEITVSGEDGAERFFSAHGTRLPDANGKSTGALLVINEVTRLRRLENIRRDFVANVSHELKTPITSIEGFSETLLDGALSEPEDARRFVEIIAKQARRLHAIVEDLLTLSRIEQESKREEIALGELPLAETLRAAIQACHRRAEEKKMAVNLHCPEDLNARINPALLEQALVNLVDNAIKYGKEGGAITVEGEKAGNEVLIMVRDNGVGIAQQDLARIFERFYRVDKARSAKLGGTGLGLSIVKHIVQAHHGHVRVESAPGRGSTFTIHLPE